MPKTALVLSGGGAKGAFQFAAEKYAREVKGYKWDLIAGVSVGALNGVMLAMRKYARLAEIWKNISNEQVYTGKMNFWAVVKMLFGSKSVYGNKPLKKLIDREVEPGLVKTDLRIGAVSLRTGEYKLFTSKDPEFAPKLKEIVLASTIMPIIWEPLEMTDQYRAMVDGGLRNISPLGDVLDAAPDLVVVINCNPTAPAVQERPFANILEIGKRSLEVALNEIFVTDIREFLRVNKNVQEAAAHGCTLHNEEGKAFKYYECKIIQPEVPLGDTLDFSREAIRRSMDAGWAQAQKVLG
ncbi:MAG: patatin-like phospholipase family protein [candidate division Zixibacteria bacterium]|nr:patatin-like phospholipase family protein [candidate division Zixibacteria bacterium]